jgi:hypothetical protein
VYIASKRKKEKNMALIAKQSGPQIEPVPSGSFAGRCVAVYDIGTHRDEKFDKSVRKCVISWEIPEVTMATKDGETMPRFISNTYSVSLHEKANLRKTLEAWRGKKFTEEELQGFDLQKLLGVPCLLQVVHQTKAGKTYANIGAIMSLPKGMACPPQVHPSVTYSMEEGVPEIPATFPKWITLLIMQSEEYKAEKIGDELPPANQPDAADAAGTDDLPF